MLMSKERESDQALPERWSAKAKSDVVLRLFRGERFEGVSREIQVPAQLGSHSDGWLFWVSSVTILVLITIGTLIVAATPAYSRGPARVGGLGPGTARAEMRTCRGRSNRDPPSPPVPCSPCSARFAACEGARDETRRE